MNATEGLLVVIVIVLTFCLYNKLRTGCGSGGNHYHERMTSSAYGGDSKMVIPGPPNTPIGANIPCSSDEADFNYAHATYGAEGLDFKDWATSQAIDSSTVQNHAEFVKDRLEKGNTGRTWSPEQQSEMETVAPVPWAGLRRPQHVPVHNPTQVSEYNENDYERHASLVWRSG